MLSRTTDFFEDFGESLGVTVKLPRPSAKVIASSSFISMIFSGIIAYGGMKSKNLIVTLIGIAAVIANLFIFFKSINKNKDD